MVSISRHKMAVLPVLLMLLWAQAATLPVSCCCSTEEPEQQETRGCCGGKQAEAAQQNHCQPAGAAISKASHQCQSACHAGEISSTKAVPSLTSEAPAFVAVYRFHPAASQARVLFCQATFSLNPRSHAPPLFLLNSVFRI